MKDDNGKVIFSLLAGATAGIVTGLLLAPETGDETRAGLKQSASKFGDDFNKLLKDGLTRLNSQKEAGPTVQQQSDRATADSLLSSLNSPKSPTLSETGSFDDAASGYDGTGSDARESARYGKSL